MLRQKWGHASFSFHLDSSLKLVLILVAISNLELNNKNILNNFLFLLSNLVVNEGKN